MPDLEILGLPQSNFVWACRLAAAEKGVPHRVVPAMPHSPEILTIHPTGKVPAMRHGAVTLAESRAICGYIDAVFDGARLIPADPVAAGQVEQWVSIVTSFVDPVCVRQYLFGYLFPGTPDGSPNRAAIDAALPKMQDQLRILDKAVSATGYLAGDAFSLADVFLIPNLFYLAKAPESGALLKALPALSAYLDRMLSRPAVVATIPPPLPK